MAARLLPIMDCVLGEILLQKLPSAIYVKLDDCGLEFLPPTACDAHQLAGYDPACGDCKRCPGLIQVKPQTYQWYFQDKDFGTHSGTHNFWHNARKSMSAVAGCKARQPNPE